MKFHIETYGCAQNTSDSERITTVMKQLGFAEATSAENADVIFYNTCSVRQKAEDRVTGLRKYWQRLKKKKQVIICITGCMVGHGKYDLKSLLPEVDIVFNITDLPHLPEMIAQYTEVMPSTEILTDYFHVEPTQSSAYQGLVPIMTGCDKFCAYCIVPFARGRETSRSPEEIVRDTSQIISKGYKEIMLLGQNVDSYRYTDEAGKEYRFSDLLYLLDPLPGLERLRFTSPYPTDITEAVMKGVAELPSVCEHIHMPVQAGSDAVLKAMNRRYTRTEYFELIDKIRSFIPNVAITTDVIVGFPGETEQDFKDSVDLFEKIEFDMAYISIYSPRPGTLSAQMEDNIPYEEKKRRWNVLNEVLKKTSLRRNEAYRDQTVEIMVEKIRKNGWAEGKTRTFKIVQCPAQGLRIGNLAQVRITEVNTWSLRGEVTQTHVG